MDTIVEPTRTTQQVLKGVWFNKARGRYQAEIMVEGKRYRLGLFNTLAEAEAVVVAKREELVGEFACH